MRLFLVLLLCLPAWAQDLAFAKSGQGPGLVLIHGFAGNRGVWTDLAKDLASRFTVLAVDLPGCGQSPAPPPGPVDFGAVADAVAKVARRELEGPFVVVAHSMGGLVGLRVAAGHPELVRGLVLLDAPLMPLEGVQAEKLARAFEQDGAGTFRERYARFTSSPEQLERVVAEAGRIPGPVLAAYTRGRMVSNESTAARVKCPVLLLASPILLPVGHNPDQEARAAGYGPLGTLAVVRLGQAKHWVMWDEPALTRKALAEFTGTLK